MSLTSERVEALLAEAFQDLRETPDRPDPIAAALYRGWLAGRRTELYDLREDPAVLAAPDVHAVIDARFTELRTARG